MGTNNPTKPRVGVNNHLHHLVFAARLALPNSNCRSVFEGTSVLEEHVLSIFS